MIRNISFTVNQAKNKLTKLGMSLFYLYLMIYIAGYIGIFFGIVSLILKFCHMGVAAETPLLEIILLMAISFGMIKFFSQLILGLVEINTMPMTPSSSSNVIPFKINTQ